MLDIAPPKPAPDSPKNDEFRRALAGVTRLLDKDLCFVGGMMKSGTTWVQLLLDAHHEIACKGEGHLPNELFRKLAGVIKRHRQYINEKNAKVFSEIEGFPEFDADIEANWYRFLALSVLAKFGDAPNIRVVAERTPDNVDHFDDLKGLFPAAKFIHVIRDGRDVAVSGWHHNRRVDPAWLEKRHGTIAAYAEGMARGWTATVAVAHAFRRKNPDAMIEVRYEDLLAHPTREAARLFEFLGVDCDEKIVRACCDATSFETLTGGRRAGQEDPNSHFRKATTMQWREELSEETIDRFESIAGAQLKRLGYPTENAG